MALGRSSEARLEAEAIETITEFGSYEELSIFVDKLAIRLREQGFDEAAHDLSRWGSDCLSQNWLFGSKLELWGELGLAVRKIQQQNNLDKEVQVGMTQLMSAVHKVWPSL